MKYKTILSIFSILALTAGIVLFIQKSNDHKECAKQQITESKNGVVTIHTKHICKETYSF